MTQNPKQQEIDQNQDGKIIIFFDGYCHLCNGFVDFLIQRDFKKKLSFAPLQGSTAQKILTATEINTLDTVIVWIDQKKYFRSNAVIETLIKLGGFYTLVYTLKVIPEVFRDFIYAWIAKNRLQWFGKKESCRLPTPEDSKQLLP